MTKWFKVIYDTLNQNNMTVEVQVEGQDNWKTYKMYETKKGTYINIFGKRHYVLVPTE